MAITFITSQWDLATEEGTQIEISNTQRRLKLVLGFTSLAVLIVSAFIWYPTENPGYSLAGVGLAMILLSIAGHVE